MTANNDSITIAHNAQTLDEVAALVLARPEFAGYELSRSHSRFDVEDDMFTFTPYLISNGRHCPGAAYGEDGIGVRFLIVDATRDRRESLTRSVSAEVYAEPDEIHIRR